MITSNVTTLTLNGDETAVEFEKGYPYYFIRNDGDAPIYVSLSPGITPGAEGVYAIPAGATERIGSGYSLPKFYILGTGEAYIRGEQIATQPSFKRGGKGGGSGGNGNGGMLISMCLYGHNLTDTIQEDNNV